MMNQDHLSSPPEPPALKLEYATARGAVTLERHASGVTVRLPRTRLWVALAVWVTALMISLSLMAGLALLLRDASPMAIGWAAALIGVPLALSAFSAATNLARAVTASVVAAEVRVINRILFVKLPGFLGAADYEWERGEVDDLHILQPGRFERRWRVVLYVLSRDGHVAMLKFASPGIEAAAAIESALRAALGLGPQSRWQSPIDAAPAG